MAAVLCLYVQREWVELDVTYIVGSCGVKHMIGHCSHITVLWFHNKKHPWEPFAYLALYAVNSPHIWIYREEGQTTNYVFDVYFREHPKNHF